MRQLNHQQQEQGRVVLLRRQAMGLVLLVLGILLFAGLRADWHSVLGPGGWKPW